MSPSSSSFLLARAKLFSLPKSFRRSCSSSSPSTSPRCQRRRSHESECVAAAAGRRASSTRCCSSSSTTTDEELLPTNEPKKHPLANSSSSFKKGRGLDIECRPDAYEEELREKISRAKAYFGTSVLPTTREDEIYKSKQTRGGFRMRAVFGLSLIHI